jgi:hypothetical protein
MKKVLSFLVPGLFALLLGIAALLNGIHDRGVPPPHSRAEGKVEMAALRELLAGGRSALVAWNSNRDGNHDIFLLRLPEMEKVRLTRHPNVDTYPRISPDGDQIVFARSQDEQCSHRDKVPWDVYVLDIEAGTEKLLARNANHPTWSTDGERVFFLRNGDTVVAHEVETGEELVLFRSGEGGIPAGARLQYPDFNEEKNELAVTVRGELRMTAIFGLDGSFEKVGDGCTLTWAPGNSYLYLVGHGSRRQNVFYRFDRQTAESSKWLDLPGDHSHEYFPRVSNCGDYLVFAASTGGHELDIEDYEVFLWKIGTPWERALRLTHDLGNDSWPDIHLL